MSDGQYEIPGEELENPYDDIYHFTGEQFERIFYGLRIQNIRDIVLAAGPPKKLAREITSNRDGVGHPGIYMPRSSIRRAGQTGVQSIVHEAVHITPDKYTPLTGTVGSSEEGNEATYTLKPLKRSVSILNCTFEEEVTIENVRANISVSLLNCTFKKGIKVIGSKFAALEINNFYEEVGPGQ